MVDRYSHYTATNEDARPTDQTHLHTWHMSFRQKAYY